MMLVRTFFLLSIVAGLNTVASCQRSDTPQGALEELVATEKVETFAKHLPLPVENIIANLSNQEKAEVSRKLLIKSLAASKGIKIEKASDDSGWDVKEIKQEKDELLGTVRVKNSFDSGSETLIELEFTELKAQATDQIGDTLPGTEKEPVLVLVSMRLQEGEWRVMGFGNWKMQSVESESFLHGILPDARGELAAVKTLRTLQATLATYQTAFPDVGLPASLGALSGPGGAEPSAQHAMLLDPSFMESPLILSGYKFQYALIDPGNGPGASARYRITASPVESAKGRSLFIDQTGVVRATQEARDANENDSPI